MWLQVDSIQYILYSIFHINSILVLSVHGIKVILHFTLWDSNCVCAWYIWFFPPYCWPFTITEKLSVLYLNVSSGKMKLLQKLDCFICFHLLWRAFKYTMSFYTSAQRVAADELALVAAHWNALHLSSEVCSRQKLTS